MDFQLMPVTSPGVRLIRLAEQHARDFATRAEQHDRDGTFPFENVEALRKSGVMAACVPEELGGLGVDSIHDYVLAINRLGRGDGSTAIAANMHIFRPWWMTRYWRTAKEAGDQHAVKRLETTLRQIGAGEVIMCALISEAGTDVLHPLVEATRTEGGWLLNGRKIFGTMSPAANLMDVACRIRDREGSPRRAMARVASGAPGMQIMNNWDALGMRGSGSHDVLFTGCFVAEGDVVDTGPWGDWGEVFVAANLVITLGLVAAFLGIAETARDLTLEMVTTRRKAPSGRTLAERHAIQHTIAEIEIDLAAARAVLARTAAAADRFFAAHPPSRIQMNELHELMKDFQCTKLTVTRNAVAIVDRALSASGGAGYLARSPLSRLYRDVRAGPFMQPLSPNEAFEYIGKVTLGLDPILEDS